LVKKAVITKPIFLIDLPVDHDEILAIWNHLSSGNLMGTLLTEYTNLLMELSR